MNGESPLENIQADAIVPPISSSSEEWNDGAAEWEEPLKALPVAKPWVRICLILVALGIMVVFGIAIYLNPYRADGTARVWETHRQLGLYPCEFKRMTGLPCPSCGMTTSFSLLIRGDVWHSMQANWVGTLFASICLLYVPWAFASAYAARPLGLDSIEWTLCRIMIVLVVLLLLRWSVVLVQMIWFS